MTFIHVAVYVLGPTCLGLTLFIHQRLEDLATLYRAWEGSLEKLAHDSNSDASLGSALDAIVESGLRICRLGQELDLVLAPFLLLSFNLGVLTTTFCYFFEVSTAVYDQERLRIFLAFGMGILGTSILCQLFYLCTAGQARTIF